MSLMKSRRTWWLLLGAGALAVIAALTWVSAVVLNLEQRHLQARAETQHQERVRLALWRMDSWLGRKLSPEATRQYFEYLPFYAQQRAYTRILNEIQPGEVITPSPLLTYESPYFPLHFQVSASGEVTSPQAPTSNWRDLAESGYLEAGDIARKQPLLARLQHAIDPVQFDACVSAAQSQLSAMLHEEPPADARAEQDTAMSFGQEQVAQGVTAPRVGAADEKQESLGQTLQSAAAQRGAESQSAYKADLSKRAQTNAPQQMEVTDWLQSKSGGKMSAAAEEAGQVEIGPLVPLWLGAPSGEATTIRDIPRVGTADKSIGPALELLFVRKVQAGGQTLFQGMLADWPALRAALLAQIADIFPQAELVPLVDPGPAAQENRPLLANVPVLLQAACGPCAPAGMFSPARTTLGIAWLAVLGAIVASGITLRSSIHFGEKRSRFASAVTHELRTPLTTFRMYSEMLAEGMVRDEAQRQAYLQTLKSESSRLATLVENVLSYARLEDGRAVAHAQPTTVARMLQRLAPALERRAAAAGMALHIDNHAGDAPLVVDADVVGQILFNLVDNACKYANGSIDRTVRIAAQVSDGRLKLSVADRGPGIAPQHARVIFAPFERGAHGPGDTIPGVGLGLALCRGLARDMGGELALDQPAGNDGPDRAGASFTLTIPTG